MTRVYLDWNATAPLRSEARAAMALSWDLVGNPSSIHAEGRAARQAVEEARGAVAAVLGAKARDVIFTSGGTEANVLALSPRVHRGEQGIKRLIVSAIEHPSVLAGGQFSASQTTQAPVTAAGVLDLNRLEGLLAGQPPALVSVMIANNETGVIQPVREASTLVHAHGGLLHVDAVQALGRIGLDIRALGADLMTLSAHKVGGPKGVGALVLAEGVELGEALIRGGGQERSRRAGTENLGGIVGFGAAVRAMDDDQVRQGALRAMLETGLRQSADVVIFGKNAERLPNTVSFSAPGLKAETAVIAFDLEGIALSSGSACSSGKVRPSHVLAAMGVPADLAQGAIRISLGRDTTEKDIGRCLEAWRKVAASLPKEGGSRELGAARSA